MITIYENIDLTSLNTFGIKATARYFTTIQTVVQLQALLEVKTIQQHPKLVLGGGSNILFTKKIFDGLIIKNELMGIEVIKENDDTIWLAVGAGEVWHSFVIHCVNQNYGGIENLSLIPGTVGAAPMQNIGAYGVEVKDVIESVSAIRFETGEEVTFTNTDCHFGYRESIFKQEAKDLYYITRVVFKLTKKNHSLRTEYGAIQETLSKMNISELSLKTISDAVISIRQSKLPDPRIIGNAGSFFKNPTVLHTHYQKLKEQFNHMPMYVVDDTHVKIPAGWLIEQCGWKGKTIGNIGVHAHQALVLVNYKDGDGRKIFELAQSIQQSVQQKFDITLHMEVNII